MPEIPASEDLMREDGALKRKLVVYREVTDRLTAGHDLPVDSLHQAAHIVHEYIEGFHEGLEEACVFPALRRAGQLTGFSWTRRWSGIPAAAHFR
jgi:hemerythrin-like domain-containing protein